MAIKMIISPRAIRTRVRFVSVISLVTLPTVKFFCYSNDGNLVGALIFFNDASVVHRQLCTQSPGCVHVKDANLRCDLDMASLNTRPCK